MMYDIIIVGAGPAGATLAYKLSSLDMKVMLLEARKVIGTPIICGEFIPFYEELLKVNYRVNGLKEIYDRFITKPNIIVNIAKRINVEIESGKEFSFEYKSYTVKRDVLLKEIVKEAEDKGIHIRVGSRVTKVDIKNGKYEVKVVSNNNVEWVCSKFIVGADGLHGVVAKSLNFERGYTLLDEAIVGNQLFENVNTDNETIKIVLSTKHAPGGYGWIIPRGNTYANVGVGIRRTHQGLSLLKLQRDFIKSRPELKRSIPRSKFLIKIIPVGSLVKEIVKGNAALIGDAAGTVIPSNGGGIITAISSALILADVLSKGDDLKSYEKRLRSEIGWYLDTALIYRRVADKLLFNGKKLVRFMRFMNNRFMRDIIAGARNRFILLISPILLHLL